MAETNGAASKQVDAEILDRQRPRSLEAEQAVLGSILLVPQTCDDVALIVRPDDFYDDAHRVIFEQILAMHDEGQRADHTLLIERLRSIGKFDAIGGTAYIAEIAQSVPTAAHAEHYAKVVHEKAMLRALIDSSVEILKQAYDPQVQAREMISRAEEKVFAILDRRGGNQVHSIREVLQESLLRMDARMKNEHAAGGLETEFSHFNELTGGLHASELLILAARPSMGKTALALNIAEHVAMSEQVAVLFVSLEMSSIELADRMLCSISKVNGHRLRNGTISNEERRKLVEASAAISQAPLYIDDSPRRTMTEIAAAGRRLRRSQQLGLIVIDYLQLIEPDNPKDPRQEQVAKIARRLKALARELEIPVLCLAQLNRQAEVTKDNRPRLSHLRESGAIEQDADVVMFVHREGYYQSTEDERKALEEEAELIIAKQRNGPTGEVKLRWRREYTRFEDPEPQPYEELESFG